MNFGRTYRPRVHPRTVEQDLWTRLERTEIGAGTKSTGLRNKTFLQRDKFITKITVIERRPGWGAERERERGREGKVGQGLARDLDALKRFVAPGEAERVSHGVISRTALAFPDIKDPRVPIKLPPSLAANSYAACELHESEIPLVSNIYRGAGVCFVAIFHSSRPFGN